MIYCPKCGGETKTYSPRETDRGYQRRKMCARCGSRFKTLEVLDGYNSEVQAEKAKENSYERMR